MNHQHEPNKTARELKTRLADLSPEEQAIIRWLAMGLRKDIRSPLALGRANKPRHRKPDSRQKIFIRFASWCGLDL